MERQWWPLERGGIATTRENRCMAGGGEVKRKETWSGTFWILRA
jgi:hypothetical protein